jgi:predicted membrane protein (TIGR00267 family)
MGTGNYLSIKSKHDQYKRLRKEEIEEIETDPAMERAEIRHFYEKKGFTGKDLERAVEIITDDKDLWADTMMCEEHGMTKGASAHPMMHGFMTFCSFALFGSIPLLPYILGIARDQRFVVAIISTLMALVLLGLTRSHITRERLLHGPVEIVGVGVLGAVAAYGAGMLLKGIVGVVV